MIAELLALLCKVIMGNHVHVTSQLPYSMSFEVSWLCSTLTFPTPSEMENGNIQHWGGEPGPALSPGGEGASMLSGSVQENRKSSLLTSSIGHKWPEAWNMWLIYTPLVRGFLGFILECSAYTVQIPVISFSFNIMWNILSSQSLINDKWYVGSDREQ